MPHVSFINGLNVEKPIKLHVFISIENEKQQGENFRALIQEVSKLKDKINELIIIDTTFLHRHYNPEFANAKIKSEWSKKHEKYLALLDHEATKSRIISYKELTTTAEYEYFKNQLTIDYWSNEKDEKNVQADKGFKEAVLKEASQHLDKDLKKSVINFVLDMCTGILSIKGYYTYAGKLNPALQYVREKYKNQLKEQTFLPYRLRPSVKGSKKSKSENNAFEKLPLTQNTQATQPMTIFASNMNYNPTFFGLSVAYNADALNLSSPDQMLFMKKYMELCLEFCDNSTINDQKTWASSYGELKYGTKITGPN